MRRALLVLLLSAASVAWADAKHPNPFLSQAKVFATQGEGDKCLKRLLQAEQKWRFNDKRDRAEIELYGGICGYLIGETQAAEVSFKNAVKIDPKLELPKDLGPGIEQLWARSTGKAVPMASSTPPEKVDPKKDPKKTDKPEKTADAPVKVEPAPEPSPKKLTADQQLEQQLLAEAAAQPKKQQGRSYVLPIALGVATVGAGAAAVVLGLQAKAHETEFKSTNTYYSDALNLAQQARTEALVTNIMFGVGGALLIGTILAFVLGS